MVNPYVAMAIIAVAMVVWVGGAVKRGIGKVGHGIVHALKAIPHPTVEYRVDPKPEE